MKSKNFSALILFLSILATLFANDANARPPASAFDTAPATVADAKIADSRCTEYGVATSTTTWTEYVRNDPQLYVCASSKGVIMATFTGTDRIRVSNDDFFVAVNGTEVTGTRTRVLNKKTKEWSMIFTPDAPIASGSEIGAFVQSEVELWSTSSGSWYNYGTDVDYYVLMP